MGDIFGTGYGSSHDWRREETTQLKVTHYTCRRCNAIFSHWYDITPNIFKAMQQERVVDQCRAIDDNYEAPSAKAEDDAAFISNVADSIPNLIPDDPAPPFVGGGGDSGGAGANGSWSDSSSSSSSDSGSSSSDSSSSSSSDC